MSFHRGVPKYLFPAAANPPRRSGNLMAALLATLGETATGPAPLWDAVSAQQRGGIGALFCVRDCAQGVVAVCSYSVAFPPPPNLWFVDAPAPSVSPTGTRGPTTCSAATAVTCSPSDARRGRDLGLIDETGRLAVQLRCPRAITSVCVAEGALVLAAGALILPRGRRLSPLTRTRIWRHPSAATAPTNPQTRERPQQAEQGRSATYPPNDRGAPANGSDLSPELQADSFRKARAGMVRGEIPRPR
jgi:hypothetical protein